MKDRKYYVQFDFVRILSAMAVAMTFHYGIVFGVRPLSGNIVMDGLYQYAGYVTELFFMISGFFSQESMGDRLAKGEIGFADYFWKKIKRLYPEMIISVIAMAAAQWIHFRKFHSYAVLDVYDGRNGFVAFVASLFGVNSGWFSEMDQRSINGPTWYISVLIICYLWFFFINRILRNKKQLILLSYIGMVILGCTLYIKPLAFPLLYYSCSRGYFNFFLGALISKLKRQNTKVGNNLLTLFGVSMVIGYWMMYKTASEAFRPLLFTFFVCGGLFVAFVFIDEKWVGWMRYIPLLRELGAISFGIYLWNIPTFAWVKLIEHFWGVQISYENDMTWLCIGVLNIILAVISNRLFEKRG